MRSFGSTAARTTPGGIARGSAAVQSTLCTRRDNNLLTRTCRLKKEGPTGWWKGRTGLSYECEFLLQAAWLRGWKWKKREKKNGASRKARQRRAFVVTRIHQSIAHQKHVSNGLAIFPSRTFKTGMIMDKERCNYHNKLS